MLTSPHAQSIQSILNDAELYPQLALPEHVKGNLKRIKDSLEKESLESGTKIGEKTDEEKAFDYKLVEFFRKIETSIADPWFWPLTQEEQVQFIRRTYHQAKELVNMKPYRLLALIVASEQMKKEEENRKRQNEMLAEMRKKAERQKRRKKK